MVLAAAATKSARPTGYDPLIATKWSEIGNNTTNTANANNFKQKNALECQ
jgi:hypothetical protein